MLNNLRYIEKDSTIVDLELPVIACSFEIEKIKLKKYSYEAALLLNFFKNNPFYKCNFDEILKINKVGEEEKGILKDEMKELLTYKKLFNNSSYYNDLQEMSIGLSPLGSKLFEEGYILTNEIETEKYTFYYDIATGRFLNENESSTVLANKKSFFHNKNYRFLRNYIQEDNSFLKDKNFSAELPIPMQLSEIFSGAEQENAVNSKIKNGYYFSKQKLTKKKLTSRLIKNGLSITQKYNRTIYQLDKKFEDTFAGYRDDFIASVQGQQQNKNTTDFTFGVNTFKYLSWTTEELKEILTIHDCMLFLPQGLKAPIPYNKKNTIIHTSRKLFSPNSEFEFYMYALDHMYVFTQSFYKHADFKEYMGNKISKEKFFQAVKFYLDTPVNDPRFHELLPIIEATKSLGLFIKTLNNTKRIALQKLIDANQFFKKNSEWSSFFKRYMLDILFKEIMSTSYRNLKALLALHRLAEISEQEFLDIVQRTEYILPIELQGFALSELERKCLWYDELYHHNFLKETIKQYIQGIAPMVKQKNAFSEETATLLSDEFKALISIAG